ncbi:MAG: rhodanese-like domain-containing protein [Bacteroidota bacterium]
MKSITVEELKEMRDNNVEHQLIDVREAHELEICEIGGMHIPMGEIMSRLDELRKDVPVILHCRSGARSMAVGEALQKTGSYEHLVNLKGGILAWAEEIDDSLEQY